MPLLRKNDRAGANDYSVAFRLFAVDENRSERMIGKIESDNDIEASVQVIRDSFATVASEFGLTSENSPSNSAFIDKDELLKMRENGNVMFGAFDCSRQVGFVSLKKASEKLYYLEKLAVLPDSRHLGIGKTLMDFSFEFVKGANGKTVSVGIIDENTRLKNWYIDYGFRETEIKRFPHLPFTVCILEKNTV